MASQPPNQDNPNQQPYPGEENAFDWQFEEIRRQEVSLAQPAPRLPPSQQHLFPHYQQQQNAPMAPQPINGVIPFIVSGPAPTNVGPRPTPARNVAAATTESGRPASTNQPANQQRRIEAYESPGRPQGLAEPISPLGWTRDMNGEAVEMLGRSSVDDTARHFLRQYRDFRAVEQEVRDYLGELKERWRPER